MVSNTLTASSRQKANIVWISDQDEDEDEDEDDGELSSVIHGLDERTVHEIFQELADDLTPQGTCHACVRFELLNIHLRLL